MALQCTLLGGNIVVHTIEPDGLLAQGFLRTLGTEPERLRGIGDWPGEVALEGITCNHTEAWREGLDVFSVEQVVTAMVRSR